MEEPWEIYYKEILERADEIEASRWSPEDEAMEAAHAAYRATVDRLVARREYQEEEAVELGKAFGRAVKAWIEEGSFDFDDLADRLEERQGTWEERQLTSF